MGSISTPKYDITYDRDFSVKTSFKASNFLGRPSSLNVTVQLPGVMSVHYVNISTSERRVTVDCGDKYKLDVSYVQMS